MRWAGPSRLDHVAQHADARHLDLDHIAGLQEPRRVEADAGPGRGAGRDDVAGLQRRERRKVGDQVGEVEHQVRRRIVLPRFAVDARLHPQVGVAFRELVGRDDPGADRAGGVEVLPLGDVELGVMDPVADGSFVDAGEAADVRGGVRRRDPPAGATDDDADLAFIVELLRLERLEQRAAVTDERVRHPHEDARVARQVAAVLVLGVAMRVVDADAKDLARLGHRQPELHVVQPEVGGGVGKRCTGPRHRRLTAFEQGGDRGGVREAAAEVDDSLACCSAPPGLAFVDVAE